jgi:PhnB protein
MIYLSSKIPKMKTDTENQTARFAPIMYMKNVADAVEFYKKAFDVKVLRLFNNDDGSIHVAELLLQDAIFHLHEETEKKKQLSPGTLNGTSVIIGLFVENTDELFDKAVAAGASVTHPMQDYEYGYRQGDIIDPFGHHWTIEKKI